MQLAGPEPDTWTDDTDGIDWYELSELYRIAPLGDKPPAALQTVFANSRFTCFVRSGTQLIGVGRALADGFDCAYIADVAVRPDHQGRGLGKAIVRELVRRSSDHKKVILYASPGTEPFYDKLGFLPMSTAMAIFKDPQAALAAGVLHERGS
jgi:ribosomal protein S18 acetylase RimI-like enzyme